MWKNHQALGASIHRLTCGNSAPHMLDIQYLYFGVVDCYGLSIHLQVDVDPVHAANSFLCRIATDGTERRRNLLIDHRPNRATVSPNRILHHRRRAADETLAYVALFSAEEVVMEEKKESPPVTSEHDFPWILDGEYD